NCEHLIEATAELAQVLLQNCPALQVLATSREVLRIAGEAQYRVPSLAVPEQEQYEQLGRLDQYEAIQLFVERARAVQPAFAVTDDTVWAVVQVCQKLDGIPLAI